jgi:hypothetical protein
VWSVAAAITKNAAQAYDIGVGQGTHRPLKFERNTAVGRRLLVSETTSRARVFPARGTRLSEQMVCIDTHDS